MRTRGATANPADNIISGSIDKEQTWYEDIELTLNGEPLTGVSSHTWTLTLYRNPGDCPELTINPTILENTGSTLLQIRCASSRLSGLCGDYWCDITSVDPSVTVDGESRIILRGRGVVTVTEGPA